MPASVTIGRPIVTDFIGRNYKMQRYSLHHYYTTTPRSRLVGVAAQLALAYLHRIRFLPRLGAVE